MFTPIHSSNGTAAPSAPSAPPACVEWAKQLVAHDMGLKDEALLDETFVFWGPFDGCVRACVRAWVSRLACAGMAWRFGRSRAAAGWAVSISRLLPALVLIVNQPTD